MEPTDLNPPSSDDERLQAMLRESSPPLADDGFSARVMVALPPEKHIPLLYVRLIVCALGALIGLVFTLKRGVSTESLTLAANQIFESMAQAGVGPGDSRIVLAAMVTALSLLYAFKRQLPSFRILSKL
jgi:hypothetical protein